MPSLDQCTQCGTAVKRGRTSAAKIICRPCRRMDRCGTLAGYAAGCKCQPCKTAKAASIRAYVAKRKAEGRPVPKSDWREYENLTCDCCGNIFKREKRNQKRYTGTYCSYLCRDYTRWGPLSKKLPKTHWVNMIGATSKWTPPKPEGPYSYTCGWCDTQGVSDYPTTEYCDTACKKRAGRARRRAKQFGAHGTYTWGQVVGLWAQFNKACAYCHTPTELEHIQAEHVIALARGGANNISNILPSCAPCNSDKRDLTMDEWKADRERRNLPEVTTHWHPRDRRYAHLGEVNYLLAA